MLARPVVIVLFASLLVAVPGPSSHAQVPDGGEAVAACREHAGDVPELGERACRSLESVVWNNAAACRRHGLPEDACSVVDGRVVHEAQVAAYEDSWVHRALTLQRALDDDVPLKHALIPGSHNSFNSFAYDPTLSGLDSNHVYPLRDQLRMDMRSLELDVHWAPSVEGLPEDGFEAPILCHGLEESGTHPGCTVERHLRHGLAEIRGWLDANPADVIVLYLENHLEEAELPHRRAAETITAELGGLIVETPEPCAPMPTDLSRADIRDVGAQVLIVGDCDASHAGWGALVHERAQEAGVWWERGSDPGTDYPSDCAVGRAEPDYDTTLVRFFEGQTWLQTMVGDAGEITATEVERMVGCGVNLFGLDHLTPDDPRLEAFVWSWAPDEPSAGCVYRGTDGRFRTDGCEDERPYTCFDGSWFVTASSGLWEDADAACAAEGGAFAVPRTGWENSQVPATEAWLDHEPVFP